MHWKHQYFLNSCRTDHMINSHDFTKVDNQKLTTHTHTFDGPFSRTTWVSRYQKGKTSVCIVLKQETVSGSGISWAICKSAPRSRQITTPTPHPSVCFFYRPDALHATQPTASMHWRHESKADWNNFILQDSTVIWRWILTAISAMFLVSLCETYLFVWQNNWLLRRHSRVGRKPCSFNQVIEVCILWGTVVTFFSYRGQVLDQLCAIYLWCYLPKIVHIGWILTELFKK